ncbi:serine/arginine repetitive matrix protein 1-like [Gallus gallus]|uniref:serine/arginine repetitive matrix protein 1-like n=1 Tax=Gallus gallus TaxID=9031 RepID=UPI001AEB942C|nr:serine/arginine repetitive matrix protein 1-like [Gallus gallus]
MRLIRALASHRINCASLASKRQSSAGCPAGRQDGALPSAPSPHGRTPARRQRAGKAVRALNTPRGQRQRRTARPGPRCPHTGTPSPPWADATPTHRHSEASTRPPRPGGARTRRCTPGPSSPHRPETSSAPGLPPPLTEAADSHRLQPGRARPPGRGTSRISSQAAPRLRRCRRRSPQRRDAHQRAAKGREGKRRETHRPTARLPPYRDPPVPGPATQRGRAHLSPQRPHRVPPLPQLPPQTALALQAAQQPTTNHRPAQPAFEKRNPADVAAPAASARPAPSCWGGTNPRPATLAAFATIGQAPSSLIAPPPGCPRVPEAGGARQVPAVLLLPSCRGRWAARSRRDVLFRRRRTAERGAPAGEMRR